MKQKRTMDQAMGEVRTEVKLTNLFDWEKAQEGKLKPSRVRTVTTQAMVDTGAVRCVLPPHVVRRLGLKPRRTRVVQYADGRREEVGVVSGVIFEILTREAQEDASVLGDEVLIGQTVLETMDLLVDCQGCRLVPNPAHPDQPVTKLK
ncbi:MAG: retroviral-like aspartic protease family protein [Verrucomicrobiota bacterium]